MRGGVLAAMGSGAGFGAVKGKLRCWLETLPSGRCYAWREGVFRQGTESGGVLLPAAFPSAVIGEQIAEGFTDRLLVNGISPQ
jgi:hypothetical protein